MALHINVPCIGRFRWPQQKVNLETNKSNFHYNKLKHLVMAAFFLMMFIDRLSVDPGVMKNETMAKKIMLLFCTYRLCLTAQAVFC
jgi:hypothetical protein